MNGDTIRFTKGFMLNLIESVSVTVGGEIVSTHRTCSKCGKFYGYNSGTETYEMIWRELQNRGGDMTRCWDCDEDKKTQLVMDIVKRWRRFVNGKKEWKKKIYDVHQELTALPPQIIVGFPGGLDYHTSLHDYDMICTENGLSNILTVDR